MRAAIAARSDRCSPRSPGSSSVARRPPNHAPSGSPCDRAPPVATRGAARAHGEPGHAREEPPAPWAFAARCQTLPATPGPAWARSTMPRHKAGCAPRCADPRLPAAWPDAAFPSFPPACTAPASKPAASDAARRCSANVAATRRPARYAARLAGATAKGVSPDEGRRCAPAGRPYPWPPGRVGRGSTRKTLSAGQRRRRFRPHLVGLIGAAGAIEGASRGGIAIPPERPGGVGANQRFVVHGQRCQ